MVIAIRSDELGRGLDQGSMAAQYGAGTQAGSKENRSARLASSVVAQRERSRGIDVEDPRRRLDVPSCVCHPLAGGRFVLRDGFEQTLLEHFVDRHPTPRGVLAISLTV